MMKIPKGKNVVYKIKIYMKEIYDIGRKNYNDKVLGHCILASFTSEMVREYYSYCRNEDAEAKKWAAKRLKKFRGFTFGGEWLCENMPKVNWEEGRQHPFAYIHIENRAKAEITDSFLIGDQNQDTTEKLISEAEEFVRYLECISFLFSSSRNQVSGLGFPNWTFKISSGLTIDGYACGVI